MINVSACAVTVLENSCDNGIFGDVAVVLVPADKGLAAYFGVGRHIGRAAVFDFLNDLIFTDDNCNSVSRTWVGRFGSFFNIAVIAACCFGRLCCGGRCLRLCCS